MKKKTKKKTEPLSESSAACSVREIVAFLLFALLHGLLARWVETEIYKYTSVLAFFYGRETSGAIMPGTTVVR